MFKHILINFQIFKILSKEQLRIGEKQLMSYGFHLTCFVIQGPGYQAFGFEDVCQWIQCAVWDSVYGSGNWQSRTHNATPEFMCTCEGTKSHEQLGAFVSVSNYLEYIFKICIIFSIYFTRKKVTLWTGYLYYWYWVWFSFKQRQQCLWHLLSSNYSLVT